MTRHIFLSAPRRRARGLSLVEIMVGVAIGLIGLVAIFQSVAVWSKHSATTSSGGDAQITGSLALFSIERDIKQAGHGFGRAASAVMGCNVNATDTAPARIFNFAFRPVDIVQGVNGAPDQIDVLYGNSSFYVEESPLLSATATTKTLARSGGFKKGDLAVAAFNPGATPGSAACQLIEITDDADPVDSRVIHHDSAGYTSFYDAQVHQARFNSAVAPPAATGTIYNLGPLLTRNVWSVPAAPRNRMLVRAEAISNAAEIQVAEGVVNIKAEYGYDLDGDGQISNAEWVPVLPVTADYRRVIAIRVAVLVRGRQFERNGDAGASVAKAVTSTAANPFYFGDAINKKFLMTNIDGTPDSLSDAPADAVPNNWRYYRYRVYERVIPLRNALWGTYG